MKTVLVAGLHGNERLPVKALEDLNIDFILGNPLAYEKNVRFTEDDLNSSFGLIGKSYEIKRAGKILELIPENHLVIDFHTTTAVTEPFVIIVDVKMLSFAQTLGIKKIVLMKHNIKGGHALLNFRNGVSVELGQHDDLVASYELVKIIIQNLNSQKNINNFELFEVYDVIKNKDEYINFKQFEDEFVPILSGEESYWEKGIYGLKAQKVTHF